MLRFFTPQNQNLLKQLVITDFKLRYQGSALGYLWSLLKPLLLFGVLYAVFTYVLPLGKGVPHYPAYLLLGVVLWNFFVEATTMGMGSIVGRGDMVRKVKISKPAIVIASILSAGVNLCLNLIVVGFFMTLTGVEIQSTLLFLPLVFVEIIVLALAISFFLSALYVQFRDIAPIWEVVLQVMFYATPIIYPMTLVPESLRPILFLNPIAQIIQDAREMLITSTTITAHETLPSWVGIILPVVSIGVLAFGSIIFFRKSAKSFAENL